ncbi:MAG: hypothetical protein H6772_00600 [Pseudomonadales bacterium]|nr:hypothetical protein [Pseudomonadales bacterium]
MKYILKIEKSKPISQKTLTRILVFIIFILSLIAGYYHNALILENQKYLRLEDRYVRVRGELGIDETQKLIDQSRQEN